jgi:hypothetical protein
MLARLFQLFLSIPKIRLTSAFAGTHVEPGRQLLYRKWVTMPTKIRRPRREQPHERLERLYQSDNNLGTLVIFVALFLLLLAFAFSMFGARNDKAKFTSDVTPKHIQLGSLERTRTLQM